jgi:hypothetical protein
LSVRFSTFDASYCTRSGAVDLRKILAALPQVLFEQGDLLLEVGEEFFWRRSWRGKS